MKTTLSYCLSPLVGMVLSLMLCVSTQSFAEVEEKNNVDMLLNDAFKVYEEAQSASVRELRMDKFKRAQHLFTRVAEIDGATADKLGSPSFGGSASLWTILEQPLYRRRT